MFATLSPHIEELDVTDHLIICFLILITPDIFDADSENTSDVKADTNATHDKLVVRLDLLTSEYVVDVGKL